MTQDAEPLFENNLTKKFLMGLPNSVYVVSNIALNPTCSIFAENISAETSRLEQWKKIVELGVDQRLCRVFKNKAAFDSWASVNLKDCNSKENKAM